MVLPSGICLPATVGMGKIDVPAVERRLNFHPEQVKIVKDMEKHITYFHRIKSQDF